MKAYWHYRCDYGHSWVIFRDEEATELPDDVLCPNGHEAVTLQKQRLLDVVQVSFRPAARVVDSTTGQVAGTHDFYLVVTDLHSGKEAMSKKTYTWQGIKDLSDRFRALSFAAAKELMQKIA